MTAPGAYRIWKGTAGDSWEDPANWDPAGVPATTDNILVPCCVTIMPQVLNNGSECYNITIQPEAKLTVVPGIQFTVHGTIDLK